MKGKTHKPLLLLGYGENVSIKYINITNENLKQWYHLLVSSFVSPYRYSIMFLNRGNTFKALL